MNQGRSAHGHESDNEGRILPVPNPEMRRRRSRSDAAQYPQAPPQGRILHSSGRHHTRTHSESHTQNQTQIQRKPRIRRDSSGNYNPHFMTVSHVPVESIPIPSPSISQQQAMQQSYMPVPDDTRTIHGMKDSQFQYSRCTGKKKALCVRRDFTSLN